MTNAKVDRFVKSQKNAESALFCHSGEGRNPGKTRTSGPRLFHPP